MKRKRARRKRILWIVLAALIVPALVGYGALVLQIYLEETGGGFARAEQAAQLPVQTLPPEAALAAEPVDEEEPEPEPEPEPMPTPTPKLLAGLKIGIDPGHQLHMNSGKEAVAPGSSQKKAKVSSGTTGVATKIPEYVTNLEISMALRNCLEAFGADVKMTRELHDIDISNIERATMMNDWGADLVLRIHCNGVSNRKKRGIGLYVKKSGDMAKESYEAAEALLPAMIEATGAKQDGIFKRDIYSGLNWSKVPSILVENGYMSNPEEDELLNDPNYQLMLAEGITQGVIQYFDRALTTTPIAPASPIAS